MFVGCMLCVLQIGALWSLNKGVGLQPVLESLSPKLTAAIEMLPPSYGQGGPMPRASWAGLLPC
jgi:hypothetical protein